MSRSLLCCVAVSFLSSIPFARSDSRARANEHQAPTRLAHAQRYSLAFSPDGNLLASGGRKGDVVLWDLKTGKQRWRAGTGQGTITRLTFSPDGKTLLIATSAGEPPVGRWDVATGKRLDGIGRRLSAKDPVTFVSTSPVGDVLAWGFGDVYLVSVPHWTPLRRFSPSACAESAVFSPDGRTLASAGTDGKVELWEVITGQKRGEIAAGVTATRGSQAVAFARDGRSLWTTGEDGLLRSWDLASGKERRSLAGGDFGFWVETSPDGRVLLTAHADRVYLWDATTGKKLHVWKDHLVRSASFSPDGDAVALGGYDEILLVRGLLLATRLSPAVPVKPMPPVKRTAGECRRFWADLDGADAGRAWKAIGALAESGEQALPGLKERLHPIPRQSADLRARITGLVRNLDHERFVVRQKAEQELARLQELARPALERELAGKPSLEVRRRSERLLEALDALQTSPERLRASRALEVLERAARPASLRLLEELAAGEPGTWLTRQARAIRQRLER